MTYYFNILILSIIVPLIFSFHPQVKFNSKFSILIKSIPLAALPYIIWDIIFARMGVWGFNEEYVSNHNIFGLPIEEILFFFIIPFCCIYSYYLIERFDLSFFKINDWSSFNTILSTALVAFALWNYDKVYTFFCLNFCALVIFFESQLKIRINYNYFYTTFILLLVPFFLVNGALTGFFFDRIVVWYNTFEIVGIRLLTIPLEDTIFSYQMILFNLIIYKNINSESIV